MVGYCSCLRQVQSCTQLGLIDTVAISSNR
jgi:hypothetical protein